MALYLETILNYLEAAAGRRCVTEGENVLLAKLLVVRGKCSCG